MQTCITNPVLTHYCLVAHCPWSPKVFESMFNTRRFLLCAFSFGVVFTSHVPYREHRHSTSPRQNGRCHRMTSHTYVRISIHTYIHTLHTFVHSYIHTYIHTYIHRHTHTDMLTGNRRVRSCVSSWKLQTDLVDGPHLC